ncbi:MAG: hypothetical protein NT067_05485 [Candidatus Diapherotrites archaeon]|nr:hypothetical protein [Candidatus Diapherotrites archaeon]
MDKKQAGNYLTLLALAAILGLFAGIVFPRTETRPYGNAGLCPAFKESFLLANFDKNASETDFEIQNLAVSYKEPVFCSYLIDAAWRAECEKAASTVPRSP